MFTTEKQKKHREFYCHKKKVWKALLIDNEFEKMVNTDDVSDPILISKCNDFYNSGISLVSNKGIAWKKQTTARDVIAPAYSWKKSSKWVRWHDDADIIPLRPVLY